MEGRGDMEWTPRAALRDPATGQPYLLCPKCGHRILGYGQKSKPCPKCLNEWLRAQGIPFMEYAREAGEEG